MEAEAGTGTDIRPVAITSDNSRSEQLPLLSIENRNAEILVNTGLECEARGMRTHFLLQSSKKS